MERIFRRGLAVFRWGALVWLTTTLVIYWDSDYLRHRSTAVLLVALATIVTIGQTALVRASLSRFARRLIASGEVLVGLAFMTLDGYVRRENVVFETGPTLGSWWPVVGLMSAASYVPVWLAVIGGALFGVARAISVALNGITFSDLNGSEILSVVNTGIFAALAAASVCWLMRLLRSAESQVALARAREEVARTLHDGVLQTLAIVERRSSDDTIVQLARTQERELRSYLFSQKAEAKDEHLAVALRAAADRFSIAHGAQVHVMVADDLDEPSSEKRHALVSAVREALTNAAKHGAASVVHIYVEPTDDGGLFCSVKDDGTGFDVAQMKPGVGVSRSIIGRLAEVDGRVEFRSSAETGTEVLIWLK